MPLTPEVAERLSELLDVDAHDPNALAVGLNAVFANAGIVLLTSTPAGYNLTAQAANLAAPADSTTYYFGSRYGEAPTTFDGYRRLYIPKTGTIKAVYVWGVVQNIISSAESSTISVRKNSTSDTVVSSAFTFDNGGGMNTVSKTDLAIAVAAGDFIELKLVTPAWATNPTDVVLSAQVYIE